MPALLKSILFSVVGKVIAAPSNVTPKGAIPGLSGLVATWLIYSGMDTVSATEAGSIVAGMITLGTSLYSLFRKPTIVDPSA